MKGNWSIVRQVFQRRFSTLRSSSTPSSRYSTLSSSSRSLILASKSMSSQIARNSLFDMSTISASIEFNFSNTSIPRRRSLCSAAGGSFIAPVIEELSKQYPDVTTYKVDIDEGGISNSITKLNIAAVVSFINLPSNT